MKTIKCETKDTWRNIRTGQVYADEKEANFDLTAKEGEIVKDVTVTISPEGLDVLNKLMNQK
jgi:hypothetical protein